MQRRPRRRADAPRGVDAAGPGVDDCVDVAGPGADEGEDAAGTGADVGADAAGAGVDVGADAARPAVDEGADAAPARDAARARRDREVAIGITRVPRGQGRGPRKPRWDIRRRGAGGEGWPAGQAVTAFRAK